MFALGLTGALAVPLTLPGTAVADSASIVFNDPASGGPLTAGSLRLSGRVSVEAPTGTTTALYLVDVSRSTEEPRGLDCDGNGALDANDDLNGDGRTGDILDCEISGVKALDASLAPSDGIRTGLEAFSSGAVVADLDPSAGVTPFVPAGYTGGDPRPRVVTAARSLARNRIKRFTHFEIEAGSGTNLDAALRMALETLPAASTGPRWIMLLSDGKAAISDQTVTRISNSGVRLRSYALGSDVGCGSTGVLARLAAATGETCVNVKDPAQLATALVSSQPRDVESVEVAVGGVTVAADVDPVGNWSTNLSFGEGTYTAVATARLRSGATVSAQRTFSVAGAPATGGGTPGPSTPPPPPPGVVAPGPGALLATRVQVRRPTPIRARLPKKVSGAVGPAGATASSGALAGSTVQLQAHRAGKGTWATVGKATTDGSGAYQLRWQRRRNVDRLRVVLLPGGSHAGARAGVPQPLISWCRVKRATATDRDVTCRTTAAKGKLAKAKVAGKVVDRAKVRRHTFTVTVKKPVGRYVLVVKLGPGRKARLPL